MAALMYEPDTPSSRPLFVDIRRCLSYLEGKAHEGAPTSAGRAKPTSTLRSLIGVSGYCVAVTMVR